MYQCDICGYLSLANDDIDKAIMKAHAKEHDETDKQRSTSLDKGGTRKIKA